MGGLDESFGSNGTVELGNDVAQTANFVRLDSQGRVLALVTGYWDSPGELTRLSPSGDPDSSFGTNGVVQLDPDYFPTWLELGADDSAYVAIDSHQGYGDSVRVLKLGLDGSPDSAYGGGDGVAVAPDPGVPASDARIETSLDGSVFLLTRVIYTPHMLTLPGLSHLDPTGTIDPAMPEVYRLGGETSAQLLAVGPDGEPITGITNWNKPSPQERLVAIADDGGVDSGFGYGGPSSFFAAQGPQLESYAAAFDRSLPVSFHGITEATETNVTAAGYSGTRKGTGPHVAEVARFALDAGPNDADADGFEDAVDPCPLDYGKSHRGCRLVRRSIRMSTTRLLHGTVKTNDPLCADGFTIQLIDRRRGRVLARGSTEGAIGRWAIDHRLRDGHYSLRLHARRLEDRLVCSSSRVNFDLVNVSRR